MRALIGSLSHDFAFGTERRDKRNSLFDMVDDTGRNLILSAKDLQAIIVGVASSDTLIAGIANHLRPQLDSLNAQPTTQGASNQHSSPQQLIQSSQTTGRQEEVGIMTP